MSLLNRVPCVPACQRGLLAEVVSSQTGLRACVSTCHKRANFSFLRANMAINLPTFHTACQCFNLAFYRAKRRANFTTCCVNVPKGVSIFQTLL